MIKMLLINVIQSLEQLPLAQEIVVVLRGMEKKLCTSNLLHPNLSTGAGLNRRHQGKK